MKNKDRRALVFAFLFALVSVMVLVLLVALSQRTYAKGASTENAVLSDASGSRSNYLLLGKDRASGLTDVIMLFSVDSGEKSVSVIQIPRDTYAKYTEKSYRKLNGALSYLGVDGVCDFVEESFGIGLDGYFVFDLDVLVKAVDMLGGVEVNVPEGMYYRDDVQGLDIALDSGTQVLDGKAAEKFVRYRSGYLRGDLGRIDAQKIFLSALVKKAKSTLTPMSAIKLASSLMGDVTTNVKLSELASLALTLYDVREEDIVFVTLAGEDIRSEASGAWYYVLSKSSSAEILKSLVSENAVFDKNRVFCEIGNESFERIYNSKLEYRLYTSKDIAQNGIEIEKR